ncbi:MAG TPA: serine/threonine-protein kinase [Steroidobacteraceae bacterium]|nr:serine/threonine-protein kinase [Steroidobacteraceae bacterium]
MALTSSQMTRLGELLDASLPLSLVERRDWLASLPAEDEPLRQTLSDALLTDDPAPLAGRLLERPPRVTASGLPSSEIEHQAGERLGAYELLRPLGAGGMAEVWLARRADGAFDRQVALKIPRLGLLPAEISARFARECRILASLEAPGIARLYDAGVDERGVPYIAMEYVAGEPLTSWCDARKLDPAARVAVILQVLDAVGRAHVQQIIHRDLKPSNILVTQGEIRLLDFGIARLLQGETGDAAPTHAWGRALTPEYASPEMLHGASVDARTDIYSLGVVLHELLTGARPVIYAALHSGGDTQGLPAGLRAVLMKALAPSPNDRYPDAASFAAALRPFAATGEPATAAGWRLYSRPLLLAGIATVFILASYLLLGRRPITEQNLATSAPPSGVSLAVLPFADLSAARDQEYLSEGMADEIINQLTHIPALRLVGLRSTLLFKGRNEDLRVIGQKLGVDHLLDGTIRRDGDRLRIAAQLLRARDGTPLWSNVYEREFRDVFKVQEEIARDVAQALSVKLDVGPMNRAQGGTTNLDAYNRYLRWRQLFLDERHALDDHRQRVQLLREAVQSDPRFVLAWGELAGELEFLAQDLDTRAEQLGGSQVASLRKEAVRARARVQELAPESWMALRIRSEQLANERRWAESIEVARRILDTGPFTFERAYPYINVIFVVGHFDEGTELVERVIRTEPVFMFPSRDQQWNLTMGRRYREAEAEYQRSREFEGSHAQPNNIRFLRTLALDPSDRAAVHAAYQLLLRDIGPIGENRYPLIRGLEPVLDDRAAMRAMVRKFVEERRSGYEGAFVLADALNEPEAALTSVRALLDRPENVDFRKYWQPWIMPYSRVRTLPGFKALLRDAGIVDYWRKTGKWGDFCKPVGADDFECR